ncbi:MAG: hypothetical protein ACT4QG_01000 [Sporichthyaceae bacterium]
MNRFFDPMGLIAGTWNWTSDHGGAGMAAFVAAGIVTLAHLAVAFVFVAMLVNARGVGETVRGFRQGVNEPAPTGR